MPESAGPYDQYPDAEVGKRFKSKYPGAYDKYSDDEIGRRVKAKYRGGASPEEHGGVVSTVVQTGKGLIPGVVGLAAMPFRIMAGQISLLDKALGQLIPGHQDHGRQYLDMIDHAENAIDRQFNQGPKGYVGHIGSVEISGFALGKMVGGMAVPIGAVGKAAEGLPLLARLGRSAATGSLFGLAASAPDVAASKDMQEFQDRLISLGVNVGVGGLLGAALHGSVEAVRKLYRMRSSKTALPDPLAEKTKVAEGEAELARLKEEAARREVDREKWKAEDAEALKKADEYRESLSELVKARDRATTASMVGRDVTLRARRKMPEVEGRGASWREAKQAEGVFETRQYSAQVLKDYRAVARKHQQLNAELNGIAEVIAARGKPLGELWRSSSGRESIVGKEYLAELEAEINRRVDIRREALKGSDPAAVDAVAGPKSDIEAIERLKDSVEKTKNLPDSPVDARVREVADEILAAERSTLQKIFSPIVSWGEKMADGMRKALNPMSLVKEAERDVLLHASQEQLILEGHLFRARETLRETYTHDQRQLITLMNDPVGRIKVDGVPISPRMEAFMYSVRRTYDDLFNLGVRHGVLSADTFRKDFINRIYDKKTAASVLEWLQANRPLGDKNAHSLERTFSDLWAAHQKGFKPVTLDVAELITNYGISLGRSRIQNTAMSQLEAVAGERFRYLKEGDPVPAGFKKSAGRMIGDQYVDGKDGKIVSRYVQEDLWRLIENWTSAPWQSPAGKLLKPIDTWNVWNKKIKLAIDVYHLWQLHRAHTAITGTIGGWKEGLAMLEKTHQNHPVVRALLENGLNLRTEWEVLQFDKAVQSMEKRHPALQQLIKSGAGITTFSNYLWQKVAPGLKVKMAVKNLEILLADPVLSKKMTYEQMLKEAARQSNRMGGGQAWAEFGRSREIDSFLRFAVLAPDWLETRFRLAADGTKAAAKFVARREMSGAEKIAARYWLGYGIQGVFTTLAANYVIRSTWPEVNKNSETKGAWNNLTKIVFPVYDRGNRPLVMSAIPHADYIMEAMHDVMAFYRNRQSPAMSSFFSFVMGRDFKNEPNRPAFWSMQTMANLLYPGGDIIPLPMLTGGAEKVAFTENREYEATKAILRSLVLGLHNHPTYPLDLRTEGDFLKSKARELQPRLDAISKAGSVGKWWAGRMAARHNAKVEDWVERLRGREYTEQMLRQLKRDAKHLMVYTP